MYHNKINKPALLNKRVGIDTRLFQRTTKIRSNACHTSVDNPTRFHYYLSGILCNRGDTGYSGSLYSNYNVNNPKSDYDTPSTETALLNEH